MICKTFANAGSASETRFAFMAAMGLVGTEVALLDEVEGDLDGERLLKLAVDGARAPESCFERGCAGVPFGV